ncbi:MAG TPA: hypothetical protein VJH92_01550 [Candidatus Nanoarchaeia archaeon]|nr:hypothetical protein [Candidatus Nanoarchaeia archaeon]
MKGVGDKLRGRRKATRALTLKTNNKFLPKSKRSQVWVETVIYTLIALTVIGLFISFAKPKIEEIQDKAIVEQSVAMLEDIGGIVSSIVQGGAGNQRVVDIGIKKGELRIDGSQDMVIFVLEGKYTYTQPGENGEEGDYINIGNILASTQKRGKTSVVTLVSNYSGKYNLQFENKNEVKIVTKAPTKYGLVFANKGEDINNKTIIDIKIK